MSLLLEALKKAELAKQSQQQAGNESETTLPLAGGVDLPTGDADPNAAFDITTGGRGGVMTRDRLPPVDQPLEIVVDDAPGPAAAGASARSELDFRLDETLPGRRGSGTTIPPTAAGAAAAAAAAARAGTRTEPRLDPRADQREVTQPNKPWVTPPAAERQAARQVFEAKQLDYNPRRPFYITVGSLALFALGTVGYFVYQLQTPSATFAQRAAAPSSAPGPTASAPSPIAAAPSAPAPAAVAPPAAATTDPQPIAIVPPSTPPLIAVPELKPAAPTAAARTPAVASAPPVASVPPAPRPRAPASIALAPQPRALAPAPRVLRAPTAATAPAPTATRPAPSPIDVQRIAPRLDPSVERGYAAFQAGDLEAARQQYFAAQRNDPLNRDAQLGLAAIDVRTQNYTSAELRYQRILEADPRDPHALAALAGLRGGLDPIQAESRLKSLLETQPEASMLHFALGNQFASQARWGEAQTAYFKAFATDAENPDFAFNLAVSLDQLRQPKLAREYYQRAIDLAQKRPPAFDRERAGARLRELSQAQ